MHEGVCKKDHEKEAKKNWLLIEDAEVASRVPSRLSGQGRSFRFPQKS
jgi:hypothetical protein